LETQVVQAVCRRWALSPSFLGGRPCDLPGGVVSTYPSRAVARAEQALRELDHEGADPLPERRAPRRRLAPMALHPAPRCARRSSDYATRHALSPTEDAYLSEHENPGAGGSVRPRAYGRVIRDRGLLGERRRQAVLDDGPRARAFRWPPLRLARIVLRARIGLCRSPAASPAFGDS
jgi:hypothetical protein